MKAEEQNIAIARSLGHKIFRADGKHGKAWCGGCCVFSTGKAYIIIDKAKEPGVIELPNYRADLNKMHEAEKVLKNDQWYRYVAHLTHDIPTSYSYVRATAAQRAEAFLRTLNLWKDEA